MSHKPRMAETPSVRLIDLKSKSNSYFIVASVEVGNTTTKCILTATDLEKGTTYHVVKTVRMTRDVRQPKPGEKVFGKTLTGVELSRESVAELVKNTLQEAVKKAKKIFTSLSAPPAWWPDSMYRKKWENLSKLLQTVALWRVSHPGT